MKKFNVKSYEFVIRDKWPIVSELAIDVVIEATSVDVDIENGLIIFKKNTEPVATFNACKVWIKEIKNKKG